MTDLSTVLAASRLVDLTQPLGPDTILWPGSTPFRADAEITHETHGALARDLAFPEHSGTHLDAPIHFHAAGLPADELPISTLVRPAAVVDVASRVAGDAAFELSAAHILDDEERNGAIEAGDAVLVRFGWDAHRDDRDRYLGRDDALAFPGLAPGAAELLVTKRVVGIGVDTLGVDPGAADAFPVHRITLPTGLWHLEGLIGLDRLPARGAWIVVGVIPIVGGSGAPARVIAIVPG